MFDIVIRLHGKSKMNNTIKAKCRVCGRPFIKRTKSTGHALKEGERQANAVTCGQRECQRQNLKILAHQTYLRKRDKYIATNTKRYRKVYIYKKSDINAQRRAHYAANAEAIRLKRRVKK